MAGPEPTEIRINGNENPVGPGADAHDAIIAELDQCGRYPFNSRIGNTDLVQALSTGFAVDPEHILVGTGSSEILRNTVRLFASESRHIVTADPSYGSPVTEADKRGFSCTQLPLDADLRIDLDSMAAACSGAGLVYVCNPNNPTATVHRATAIERFIARVRQVAPDCLILIDEAYHDYVTDPHHRTLIPRAIESRNLLVIRTFSKAYGMAGLRLGFGIGHPDTLAIMRPFFSRANVNVLAIAAAVAALKDPEHIARERERNALARTFTRDFFESRGFECTNSQTNFLFVNLRRPARVFREECAKHGVFVARDFPPMEETHCRISIGTMEEMQQSCQVFSRVLGAA